MLIYNILIDNYFMAFKMLHDLVEIRPLIYHRSNIPPLMYWSGKSTTQSYIWKLKMLTDQSGICAYSYDQHDCHFTWYSCGLTVTQRVLLVELICFEHPNSSSIYSGVRVTQSLGFCMWSVLQIIVCHYVLFLLATVLPVLLRFWLTPLVYSNFSETRATIFCCGLQ